MPVMEGKALLFKEFAGVDAFPLCLDTTDVDEIVGIVRALAPTFGGINLEDIAAPRCFEIERRLRAELDIPVFHDDQHGTAIVVLAALLNALRVVGKRVEDARIVVTGAGAAGMACTNIILAEGATNVIVCDIEGALYSGRPGLDPERAALAERTNPGREQGMAERAARGRRCLPRTVRARCRLGGRRPNDGPGSGRLRHGQSHARGAARGRQRPRADHGHRALGLSEPDQQRARLPWRLPRCAGRARERRSTRR